MPTYTIYASASDGEVNSDDTTPNYLNMRAGTGSPGLVAGGTASANQFVYNSFEATKSASTYLARQYFHEYDTSGIPVSETVTSVVFSLYGSAKAGSNNLTVETYAYDWGGSLTTADWTAGASIGALSLLATFPLGVLAVNWSTSGYNNFTENGTNFQTAINKGGITRLMCCLDSLRSAVAPVVVNQIRFSAADTSGTTQDPKLVIQTTQTVFPASGYGANPAYGYGDGISLFSATGRVADTEYGYGSSTPVLPAAGETSTPAYGYGQSTIVYSVSGMCQSPGYGYESSAYATTGASESVSAGYGSISPVLAVDNGTVLLVPTGYGETGVKYPVEGYATNPAYGLGTPTPRIPATGSSAIVSVGYGQVFTPELPVIITIVRDLLECIEDRLIYTDAGLPSRICMVPGANVAWDDCECGQLTASMQQKSPYDRFPEATLSSSPCGHPFTVWVVVFTILRCVPTGDEHDPPTCEQLDASAVIQIEDSIAVSTGISCCLADMTTRDPATGRKLVEQFAIGTQSFVGPNGACAGSELPVYIGLLNQCEC